MLVQFSRRWLLFFFLLISGFSVGRAQVYQGKTLVEPRLIADTAAVESGKPFRIGVLLKMAPGWHVYWRVPGDSGLPTKIEWTLPPGFTVGPLQWPAHQVLTEGGHLHVNVYTGEVLLFATVTPPAEPTATPVEIRAAASWLVCEKLCVPGHAELSLTLPAGPARPENRAEFERYQRLVPQESIVTPLKNLTLLPALLFAFIGGLILNLMPCVLPVISLKMFSFVKQAGESRKRIFRLGLAFVGGMFAWFLGIGIVLLILRSTGKEISWAQQFQNPWFNIGISIVIFLFALNLLGVYEITLPGKATTKLADTGDGMGGAFFQGVFATLLGTPCTAPYLGTTLAFALTQPPLALLSVFAAIAFGMSAPYLLLCANPGWMRHLPKPGIWMVRLKEFMGFLLLATLLWFVWIVGRQLGINAILFLGALLLFCGLGTWIYGTFLTPVASSGSRRFGAVALMLVLACIAVTFVWFRPVKEVAVASKSFSSELERALAGDRIVFVDFTADWCLSCKVNKRVAIDSASVQQLFREKNVLFLEGDWTNGDPEITRVLKQYGRAGVPLYLIYSADRSRPAIVLPELLTPQIIIDALKRS